MRALTLTRPEFTRNALLRMAEEIPGAWIGIRIAILLMVLSGWKSTEIAGIFGLSRCGTVKIIQRANREGLGAIEDHPRPGRPSLLSEEVVQELQEALSNSPQDYGLSRKSWDGTMVVEYLKKFNSISIQVRQAQRVMRKLGRSSNSVKDGIASYSASKA